MAEHATSSAAYIAASTNRYPSAADSKDSLVALGSSTYVALWDTAVCLHDRIRLCPGVLTVLKQDLHDRGISETLPGHEGTVTCVQFRYDASIVSGDNRGVLRIWRSEGGKVCGHAFDRDTPVTQ